MNLFCPESKAMRLSLSKYSIHKQILIGYAPVLLVLAFLAYSSFQKFEYIEGDFYKLQDVTKESLVSLEIGRDMVELQRNVVVFSYLGYPGIIRKVHFLEKNLEEKFAIIQPLVQQDEEVRDRFERMYEHYVDYKVGFDESVRQKNAIKKLHDEQLVPIYQQIKSMLELVDASLYAQGNYAAAYEANQLERYLQQSNSKVLTFMNSPDGLLIKEAKALMFEISSGFTALSVTSDDVEISAMAEAFEDNLKRYQETFLDMEKVNRVYLQLVNVVLAGDTAEIDKLSGEINSLIGERSQTLALQIKEGTQESKRQFVALALATVMLGLVSSMFIAMGIARPVSAMAATLSKMATGNYGVEIPGLSRNDEVGQMAKAANEFKIMASQLENQTAELEEFSYRTSHDLRSPLKSAIGLLAVTKNSISLDDKSAALKTLDMTVTSLSKLEQLVQDILTLTKAKNEEEANQLVDVNAIIEEAIEKSAHMENFERLEIRLNLDFKDKFYTKKTRLVLIIENLLSNAIKYQNINATGSFVKVATSRVGNNFILSVSDNGLQIPQNCHEKIFCMFKRFHPRTSFGSGLGLYMIKKSTEILGGEITFTDTGSGSCFELSIPLV